MRTNFFKSALVLALLLAGLGSVTFAQLGRVVTADVPFEFVVGDKILAAGNYTFSADSSAQGILQIASASGGRNAFSIISRLGTPHSTGAMLVFDKVGDRHYLSEVWMPDADGYLLQARPEQHTHNVVKAKK